MRTSLLLIAALLLSSLPVNAAAKWVQDKFEIGAWVAPPVAYTTDAVYARMASAGFTLLTGPGHRKDGSAALNRQCLDICHRYGIRVILRDARMHLDPQTDEDKRTLDEMIAEYKKHPAFYGYFIQDEPKPDEYRLMAQIHAYLLQKDPGHLPYINLYPAYGGPDQLQFDDYDGYVREFVRAVNPRMISYDHYNFLRKGDRKDFFKNLEIVRREALKQDVPMWVIIQALQDATRYRPPTLNQMYWQVNCALAYGAKSIFYFPYWSAGDPAKPEEWHYLGVILPDGKPGPQYEAAREINPKLKQIGPLLMKLKSVSVVHLGDVPQQARGFDPDDLLASASGDQIVIGRFVDGQNKPVLMLVNRDWDKPGSVRINLRHGIGVNDAGRVGPGEALSRVNWNADAKELSVALAPGEGRIVRIREK